MTFTLKVLHKGSKSVFRYYLVSFALMSVVIFFMLYLSIGLADRLTAFTVSKFTDKVAVLGLSTRDLNQPTTAQVVALETPIYSLPIRLVIPKIGVDANIQQMGLTSEGDMEVPSEIEDLGWYKYGPHPGEKGSAVVAGHLGVGALEFGVFKNLNLLAVGDSVIVTDDNGLTASFTVREIRVYGKDDQATEVFSSTDGSHLNLITCTGKWIYSEKTFSQRLVVFTDRTD